MENSIQLSINGINIIEVEDTDAETIAVALERIGRYGESIRRFGLSHTLRVICRDLKLREEIMVEAKSGNHFLSTIIG